MRRYFYSDSISGFNRSPDNQILGTLTRNSDFDVEQAQAQAWLEEIRILKSALKSLDGQIYFEYSIPRVGRRADVIFILGSVIFVLEFKVGAKDFPSYAIDQVWDYALDLKNFHEGSHKEFIAPILISTRAKTRIQPVVTNPHGDGLMVPIRTNSEHLADTIQEVLSYARGSSIEAARWERSGYHPTPTIIEAATALYAGHSVTDISRNDAGGLNLAKTSEALSKIIADSRLKKRKTICFLTGVPGAGKTLVGLNIATQHFDRENELYSVYLSGNGPLVAILREALARDQVRREAENGRKLRKEQARSQVKAFIQNVHNFRDDCLVDVERPPIEHVALFDEAQRAWDLPRTSSFMSRRKGRANFSQSEPDFLISCMDRHHDWAVIICLVGGGQEINTGESGISEWIASLNRSYKHWNVHISPHLSDSEYSAGRALQDLQTHKNVVYDEALHLAVSMRSFRAEQVSLLVKQVLDVEIASARSTLSKISPRYPIVITRSIQRAKDWVRMKARGSERFGLVASSAAERLKPHAINVRSPVDPVHWFLDPKEDVRSSYYLEDPGTEFHVQGLELDWACVTWDADFRYTPTGWDHRSFVGDRWTQVQKFERKSYLKNAYRVLLTRARQGMVIAIPEGVPDDPTRLPAFYDPTFDYLRSIGFQVI